MVTMMINTWKTLTLHLVCTKTDAEIAFVHRYMYNTVHKASKQETNMAKVCRKDSSKCDKGLTGFQAVWMICIPHSQEHPIGKDAVKEPDVGLIVQTFEVMSMGLSCSAPPGPTR